MSRYPFDIQECTEGTGAACGSTYLVDGFENLLRKKLGRHAPKILTEKELTSARRYFESSIKCQFNPYDTYGDQEWEIPFPAARKDYPECGLKDGYLKLKRYNGDFLPRNNRNELESVFLPIWRRIHSMIEDQLDRVGSQGYSQVKVHGLLCKVAY